MKHKAIYTLYPNVVRINEDLENNLTPLDKNGEIVSIDMSAVNTKSTELENEVDAKQYQRDREKEYPSIADQLDDIYHNGINAWKATIKVTKDKYPKS